MIKGQPHSEETRSKMSLARRGRHFAPLSEEHKAKLSLSNKGKCRSEETRARIRLAKEGISPTEETRIKLSLALKGNQNGLGYRHSAGERAKMSKALRQRWQNPEYRDKTVQIMHLASHLRPNKPELILLALLKSLCPGEWKYVGDGQLIISGKNPDFVNINGKKQIIEMWGDYWHRGQDPQERVNLFRQYGFETLVIWESELNQPQEVLWKIMQLRVGNEKRKIKTALRDAKL